MNYLAYFVIAIPLAFVVDDPDADALAGLFSGFGIGGLAFTVIRVAEAWRYGRDLKRLERQHGGRG